MSQLLLVMLFSWFLVIPVMLTLWLLGSGPVAGYWGMALYLELILIGQLACLGIISLERLPIAVIFTLALYLFAKLIPYIALIFDQSAQFYQEEQGFEVSYLLFTAIQYVLPDLSVFARNNLVLEQQGYLSALLSQVGYVAVYSLFIQGIILIDFYRKELIRQ